MDFRRGAFRDGWRTDHPVRDAATSELFRPGTRWTPRWAQDHCVKSNNAPFPATRDYLSGRVWPEFWAVLEIVARPAWQWPGLAAVPLVAMRWRPPWNG